MEEIVKDKDVVNHYDWVDYAKGIGVTLVVYGHVARGVFNAGLFENSSLFKLVDSVIYSFHMPLFFFISGLFFVSSIQKRGAVGLIRNKVDTIVYPYFVWSLIQGNIEYGMNFAANFSTTVVDIYSIIWLPIEQFWFLYALFLVFVVMAVFYKVTEQASYLFLFALVLFFVSTPWGILNSAFRYGIYFCGGIVFSAYSFESLKNQNNWIYGVGLLAICSQLLLQLDVLSINIASYVVVMAAFTAIALVVLVSQLLARLKLNVVRIIGKQSLEIYLLHILFGSGFRVVLQKFFEVDSSVIHLIFGTVIGVGGSMVFMLFIKRIGAMFLFRAPKCLRLQS